MSWLKLYDDKMKDWQYYGNPIAVAIWIHILVEASHFDGKVSDMGVEVNKGQLTIGTHKFSGEIGINRNTLRYWLNQFEQDGQIIKENRGKYTLITIVNWEKYQPDTTKCDHHINHHKKSLYIRDSNRDKRYIPQPSYSQDEDDEDAREEALREFKNAIS